MVKEKKLNNKGGIFDLIIWLAISFVALLFFAFWIWGFGEVTDTLAVMDAPILGNPNNSIGNLSEGIFGKLDDVQSRSTYILAFVLIFFTAVSIPITNFIQKSHPVFFVVYLLVIIVTFFASVYVSNQYETLMTQQTIGATLGEFTGASFIMLNLPIWTAVIGFLGAIFLFVGILRDSGAGGGVI